MSSILPTAPAFSPVMISAVAPFSKAIWLVILLTACRLTTQLSPTFRLWSLMIVLLSWKPYWIFLPLILVLLVILISFNPFSASSIAIEDKDTEFFGTILYVWPIASSTTSISPIAKLGSRLITPSTLTLPAFKILSASCPVLATLSTSRKTIPNG